MKYEYKKLEAPVELSLKEGLGNKASDFDSQSRAVPCQTGCPAGTNIPGYIEKIAQGKFDEAYAINLEDNVFPGVLGRVCARPCESQCRHNWTDIQGTVQICSLKRTAADYRKNKPQAPKSYFSETGKKIAVIGGGPAGLTAARELKRYGHNVTIFEKEKQLGGMLVDGIPRFRLPLDLIEEETGLITETGINVVYGEFIDEAKFNNLLKEYDSVVVATGTTNANITPIEGLSKDHYSTGLEFMKEYNSGNIKDLKGDVIIIGGGFTAIDTARACARTAKRILGENGEVTIVYRRTVEHMAVDLKELNEMDKENIKIRTLLSPLEGVIENNELSGIKFVRNYLGKGKESGKPEILPVEDSEFTMNAKHLILAIGQKQDYSILPTGVEVTGKFTTNNPKIFVAGDFSSGSLDVIHSVADGKEVAELIDTTLVGIKRREKFLKIEEASDNGESGRFRNHDQQFTTESETIEVENRVDSDNEVDLGFRGTQVNDHATRCYFCHYKFEIDHEKCIHCNWCIDVTPRNCIKKIEKFDYTEDGVIEKAYETKNDEDASFIWIDTKNCIRCGKCLRTCPTRAISMRKTTLVKEPVVIESK